MSEKTNVVFELSAGLQAARVWADYNDELPEDYRAKLSGLETALARLKEEASSVEENEGDIFDEVMEDVSARMEDWCALKGEDADAYVESCRLTDKEALKSVEDAYLQEDADAGESDDSDDTEAVTAEDLAYTRLYTNMLDVAFELERMRKGCVSYMERHTVYEDMSYPTFASLENFDDMLLYMPEWEEAKSCLVECFKAVLDKYFDGKAPDFIQIEFSQGGLGLDSKGVHDALVSLDEAISAACDLSGVAREYHEKDGVGGVGDFQTYSVGV